MSVKCSQWSWWSVLLSHCNLGHRWHQENAGQDLLQLPLCSLSLQDLNSGTNTEFSITFLSLLPEGESGGLWECFCWCCVCQSQGQSPCASEVLLPAQTPQHGAVFCWAWVALPEMSAEPALALSAFTVSCKVNQMVLCDDKCYSWKSSWRRFSIRPVQKWTRSVLLKLCSVWSTRGLCSTKRELGHDALKPSPYSTGRGCCHYIECNWVSDTPEGFTLRTGWSHELCFVEGRSCLKLVFCVLCSGQELMGCFNLD